MRMLSVDSQLFRLQPRQPVTLSGKPKTRRAKHQNRVANHEQIPASPPRAETLEPTSESGRRVHTLGHGFDSCPALGVVYVPRSPVIGPPACRGT
ncbi:hypothetical protein Zmor_002613 [Zophobas morio]|uniref:Uncharacterized protein n=1 Tax=Zophobas morio TaxID=2755281 RepID=A0AA38J0X3_9CUCU|nr:hypothetical protein Zmor_021089 [Zophobas morio]KAJ3667213.1 hypothetical protein Zmor_002613 [Zophobas morio]